MNGRIIAAGAVLWRPGARDEPEIGLVHRPRYDDWSLPKGKQDPGEHILLTAVREVLEETGHRVTLGRPLSPARYKSGGRRKTSYFWAARADDSAPAWEPTAEVDEVRFLPAGQALDRLSYEGERATLRGFLADRRTTTPVVLLRHTAAVHRDEWDGDDALRPLSTEGRTAAVALEAPLAALGIGRVISSNASRCTESVRGFAAVRGLELELEPAISECGQSGTPEGARAAALKIVADGRPTVVCSHRPVLPVLLDAATERVETAVPADPLPPGGFHVLHIADGTVIAIDTHQ